MAAAARTAPPRSERESFRRIPEREGPLRDLEKPGEGLARSLRGRLQCRVRDRDKRTRAWAAVRSPRRKREELPCARLCPREGRHCPPRGLRQHPLRAGQPCRLCTEAARRRLRDGQLP